MRSMQQSEYNLERAENYVRLAFQSASKDQAVAQDTVRKIRMLWGDSRLDAQEVRIKAFARSLLKLFEGE